MPENIDREALLNLSDKYRSKADKLKALSKSYELTPSEKDKLQKYDCLASLYYGKAVQK
jgi:hypothetical protein